MSLEQAVYNILAGDAAVAALVGTRITEIAVPQGGAFPAIVYQMISGTEDMACDGLLGERDELVQITCWSATTQAVAIALREAVLAALFPANQPYTGTTGGVTITGVSSPVTRDSPYYSENEEATRYGKQIDIEFSYTR